MKMIPLKDTFKIIWNKTTTAGSTHLLTLHEGIKKRPTQKA